MCPEITDSPEAEVPPPSTFFAPSGSRFGSTRCPENRDVPKSCKKAEKAPRSNWKAVLLWLRGLDLNQRPPGYELRWVSPSALAQCFPGLFEPEIAQNPKVVPLRSTGILPDLGHGFGSHRNTGCLNGVEETALVILAGQQHRLDLLIDRARQFSQQGHTLRKVENKRAYNRTSALKKFFRSCHAANRCSHILEQGLS